MSRQFPPFGQVKDAIQAIGSFAIQTAALGFGKPRTDPVSDREVRTDANGLIWQRDETNSQWVFVGKSLQPYFGASVMDFFLNGVTITSTATEISIANEGGYHSWPQDDENLVRLPNRFLASNIGKSFNTSQPWGMGNGGNGYFNIPAQGPLGSPGIPGSTTDRILAVIMIRRESDGRIDYVISPEDRTTGTPSAGYFVYTTPQVNRLLLIGGVRWRICGVIGQLIWDHGLGRVMYSTQQGKTTYLEEEKAYSLPLTTALTANISRIPYARCDFCIFCGPSVGGATATVRVANGTSAAAATPFLVGFNPTAATLGASFNYTAPPNTDLLQRFAVSAGVQAFNIRLTSWTEETLPKLGF